MRRVNNLKHSLRGLISKYSERDDFRWKPFDYVCRCQGCNLTRRWCKNETNGVGSERNSQQRISL
jgi:hypothetical protein